MTQPEESVHIQIKNTLLKFQGQALCALSQKRQKQGRNVSQLQNCNSYRTGKYNKLGKCSANRTVDKHIPKRYVE